MRGREERGKKERNERKAYEKERKRWRFEEMVSGKEEYERKNRGNGDRFEETVRRVEEILKERRGKA